MRVSRRIRPSQVGCAASASRRRLQAASLTESPDVPQARPLPRPALVIQPDGQILSTDHSSVQSAARAAYDEAGSIAVASTRG
jgi:hypothetical protein